MVTNNKRIKNELPQYHMEKTTYRNSQSPTIALISVQCAKPKKPNKEFQITVHVKG